MKSKFVICIWLICLAVNSVTSQEKIKGNREVTIKQTYIDNFEAISVGDDFSIDLVYNSKPSVEIETDDNLHEVIKFEVVDGVLVFTETQRITSKKVLKITVNYGEGFKNIEVKGTAEIRSLTSMELGDASVSVNDNSRAYLNIRAKNFVFKSGGKSKTRLNLTADDSKIEISDDSKLEALVNSPISEFYLYQRADANIEGNADTSIIRIDNSSNFYGRDYTVKKCTLTAEGSADTTIEVTESLDLDASGDTATFLYGEPQINITKLSGSAKIQKKEG